MSSERPIYVVLPAGGEAEMARRLRSRPRRRATLDGIPDVHVPAEKSPSGTQDTWLP